MTLRIDIVTIFPEIFDVLDVSLLGKARTTGLIDLHVSNLRDFTADEREVLPNLLVDAADATELIAAEGLEAAQLKFHSPR